MSFTSLSNKTQTLDEAIENVAKKYSEATSDYQRALAYLSEPLVWQKMKDEAKQAFRDENLKFFELGQKIIEDIDSPVQEKKLAAQQALTIIQRNIKDVNLDSGQITSIEKLTIEDGTIKQTMENALTKFSGSGRSIANNVVRPYDRPTEGFSIQLLVREKAEIFKAKNKHDKAMLPIRLMICKTLTELKNQFKVQNTFFQKAKMVMSRSNRTITLNEHRMQLIEKQLHDLLIASADNNTKPEILQKKFKELMDDARPLIKDNMILASQLGSENSHVKKVNAFVAILASAAYDNEQLNKKNPAALDALEVPSNIEQVKKYMAPIEQQMKVKEASVEKKAAPAPQSRL